VLFVREDLRTPLIVTVNLESVRRVRMQRVTMQHVKNGAWHE